MNNFCVLDIETASLPESELTVPTFEAPANYKTPEAIARSIEDQRQKWASKLALSPLTGKVVAIGLQLHEMHPAKVWVKQPAEVYFAINGESELLGIFCEQFENPQTIITWNGNQFDWPFLLRRCWINGIKPPYWMRHGRYWNDLLVDARELWGLGDRQAEGTLEVVGKLFGLPPKLGNGADFAALLATDPEKAKAYVVRDLEITAGIYRRIIG